jgi:sugar-specific transcriptional regulator TrmB
MTDINYKKLYEESIFEKLNLQKEYDGFKQTFNLYKDDMTKRINEYELNINELKEKLKKYTAPKRNKTFYENHKEEIIKKNKEYIQKNKDNLKKPDPEKNKQYNKRAYERTKLKNNQNVENEL